MGTVDDVIRFYDERGYRARIGPGKAPAIVVVDFSRAFTEGPSAFPGGDFSAPIAQTRRLLDAARGRVPVYFTTIAYSSDLHDAGFWGIKVPWLKHCPLGDPIVDIDVRLDRRSDEPLIVKKYPSAFFGTDLHARLQADGVDTLVIAGCTTSVCVRATALDAMQYGYRPMVAAEAVGDFHADLHALHLKDLDSRYADVMPVDALIAYLGGENH
ncbi:MAG: isochorismatase family protein [Burkholderiales bacterium]